jgi:RNA polymerase sigma-70 factor (ECF subfamily)
LPVLTGKYDSGGNSGVNTALFSLHEFENFYQEHRLSVMGYLKAGLGNQEEAGDVLQDVFLKLLEQVKSGRVERETARAYLYRMARNAMIDRLRKKARVVELIEPEKVSYEAIEDENERIRILFMDAIADLPEEIALLLEWRLLHQKSVEEICQRLGTSRATLYRNMQKGLGRVADAFRRAGFDPEALQA